MPIGRKLLAAAATLGLLAVMGGAVAAPANPPDQFPLGQSGQSGAVCQAIRDPDDPAVQMRGARAWEVRCRGWDGALGRLYAYSYKGEAQIEAGGAWPTSLAKHASCASATAAAVKGVGGARRADCKAFSAQVAYVAYSGSNRGKAAAAEGFSQIADVLETGLRVVAGVSAPPKATQTLAAASAGGAGGGAMGLAEASEAAASAPENLRERGYDRNISWRFADAETDFRALALNESASPASRAEAYLNWALNTSNTGRFSRADTLFDQAAKFSGGDQALQGLTLSYRALHLRNQRKFQEAIALAEQARQILSSLQETTDRTGQSASLQQLPDGSLIIGPELAAALTPSGGFSTSGLDRNARIQVQIAQTELTEASSYSALGDQARSRQALESARARLATPRLVDVATFLRVQIDAELARQDQAQGRSEEARGLLVQALSNVRQRQAGSPAEAYLTMELARAEALAGDRAKAMQDFQSAIALFRESRGSLGASADSAAVYLDLLLQQSAAEPARANDYAGLYLAAVESLGSQATADTIARLSARLDQKDTAAAGLIRALEDTRRQVRAKESFIANLVAQNQYSAAVKTTNEAELKSLNSQAAELEQRVAAADPRYGQMVASDVTLSALQAKLKPGELYVKIVLLGPGGYGLAVTQTSAKPYRLAIGEAEGAAAVEALRIPFETQNRLPAYDVAASYKLFQNLFGPIQDQVLAANHIIYEPDNSILSLPIAALATDQASVDLIAARRAAIREAGEGVLSYDGVAWLGKKARTSLTVSAASFVQTRAAPASTAPRPFIGFGASIQAAPDDPKAFASVVNFADAGQADIDLCRATRTALLGLRPLGEAAQELTSVEQSIGGDGAIVTGADFSDTAIQARTDLDQFKVVYFATHGLLPQPGGCLPEPSLLTSIGAGDSDGLLNVSKILGLKLDADLVVLSACDTGGGGVGGDQDVTGLGGAGESLGGLARAFIYAGARSLVVSHWKIDSDATVRLMTGMFRSGEQTQAGALQKATLAMMNSPDQYSHPYYWSAFTIVGDGDRAMPR